MKRILIALLLIPQIAFADRSFYYSGGVVTNTIQAIGNQVVVGDSITTDLSIVGSGEFLARQDADNAKFRAQAFGTSKTGFFACDRARGTASSPTALGADESFCSWVSQGYDGTSWAHSAEILTNTTEVWSGSAHGAGFQFLAVLDGTTGQYSPMRLNYTGDGSIFLYGGGVSTGHINLYPTHASGQVRILNSAGNTTWAFSDSGTMISSNITNNIGWTPVDGANNTACNTTCSTGCVFGFGLTGDTAFPITSFESCAGTAADICFCAGAS